MFIIGSLAIAAATTAIEVKSLAGAWTARCHKAGLIGGSFVEESLAFFVDATFVREIRNFSASDCAPATLLDVRAFEGRYALGDQDKTVRDARAVDFVIDGVFRTPLGANAVKAANDTRLCSDTDWKRGVRRSITGVLCNGEILKPGTAAFDVVQLTDGKLVFGRDSFFRTGDASKERPKELDPDLTFSPAVASAH